MVMIGFTVPNAKENIRSGKKTTTIRPKLSDKTKEQLQRCGLHLYEHPRQPNMKLIGRAELKSLRDVRFAYMSADDLAALYKSDGFDSLSQMFEYFEKKYGPNYMTEYFTVIEWKDFVSGED